MVQPKNVTISKIPIKNQCSKTTTPFEEPDGMTDIDLHEIISCQNTSDSKGLAKPRKYCMSKLLVTVGTGFIITTCLYVTISLINDSTRPSGTQEYTPTNTNLQKSPILKKTSVEKSYINTNNINKLECIKNKEAIESRKKHKIKRDIPLFYDKDKNDNHETTTFDIFNFDSNENMIHYDKSPLNNIESTNHLAENLNNDIMEHPSNYYEDSENENQSSSGDDSLKEGYKPRLSTNESTENRSESDDVIYQSQTDNDDVSPTTRSGFTNIETVNQSNVEPTWSENTQQTVDSSTRYNSASKTDDVTGTTESSNLKNNYEPTSTYSKISTNTNAIDRQETITDHLSYETISYFSNTKTTDQTNVEISSNGNTEKTNITTSNYSYEPSDPFNANETANQSNIENTSNDFSSLHTSAREFMHDLTTTTDSWDSVRQNGPINTNTADLGSSIDVSLAAASTAPYLSDEKNGDQLNRKNTWDHSSEGTQSTSTHSAESTYDEKSTTDSYTTREFKSDLLLSPAVIYETTHFFGDNEDINQSKVEKTWNNDMEEIVLREESTRYIMPTTESLGNYTEVDKILKQFENGGSTPPTTDFYETTYFFPHSENVDNRRENKQEVLEMFTSAASTEHTTDILKDSAYFSSSATTAFGEDFVYNKDRYQYKTEPEPNSEDSTYAAIFTTHGEVEHLAQNKRTEFDREISSTEFYELISPSTNNENSDQSNAEETGSNNTETTEAQESFSPLSSIYSQESTHNIISTTASEENKYFNEETSKEDQKDVLLSPTTDLYASVTFTNSNSDDQSNMVWYGHTPKKVTTEYAISSMSIYPEESTLFKEITDDLAIVTDNSINQNYDNVAGIGNDASLSPDIAAGSTHFVDNDMLYGVKLSDTKENENSALSIGESKEAESNTDKEYKNENFYINFPIEVSTATFSFYPPTVSPSVKERAETSKANEYVLDSGKNKWPNNNNEYITLHVTTVPNSLYPDEFSNIVKFETATSTDGKIIPLIAGKHLTEKSNTLNIGRFNRKVSALKNSSQLLQRNSKDFASNFTPQVKISSIVNSSLPTTENSSINNLPLNVRWAGQDPTNFETIKIAAKEFGTVNEQLQSNQQSSVNQNFGKTVCPTFVSPMGFPVLQQPNAFPYLYNSNQASPYANVMPFPISRAQGNSYLPQQYSYVGTNPLASYSKAMSQQNGYVLYNVNGQSVIAPSPGGQYYICNPVQNVLGNTNTDEIPQVEIRKSMSDSTLKSFATDSLENRTRSSRDCPFGERSCEDDSKCIKTHHFCDGDVHCKDASDEAFCPCKYRIGKIRECDGYFDCPNGEDESKCFGCEANMFSCDDWSRNDRVATCIPVEQRCDGVPQCPTEKDEHDCSIITKTFSEKQHFIVSTTVGFLYRNFKGRWYPACRNPELWANEACQLAAGPSTMAPLAHLVPVEGTYDGPYISASSEEDSVIVNTCEPGAAIFVECPPIVCGMRKKIKNPFRREEVDTSAEQILSQFHMMDEFSESKNTTDSILGDSRVVGGKPSQPEAWPWVVSVYRNGVFHCGGALINELWILTAGHCVEKYWHYYYEVQAGVLRRYSYSPMIQNRMISQVVGHQLYDRTKLKNDLALMRMSKPLEFGRYVRPICLPSEITAGKNYKWGPDPGTVCTAVGWGATVEHGSDPDHLREVEVPVLKHCKHREDQEGNEICAGLMEGGKDACQGDSGGPFMCRNPNSPNQWYLAGIVSHGEGCARPNEPGVYTRVSLFLEWIFENIRAETVPQTKPLHRCPGYICKKTNRCIANKRRCNKIVDCLLADDEMQCEKRDFNEIFKHAMRHMFWGSQRSNNQTIIESHENDTLGVILTETNGSTTDNLDNTSDVTEISTTLQEIATLPSNQSYSKYIVCKRILQRISITQQCDRIFDCEDATDEENCSCKDYLRNSHPQAICNGVTDCIDMSDEDNCHVCKQNEYHCRKSNICIIVEKRCNHVPDCPFEEDEWDCFALTDGTTITLDGDLRPYLNNSGVISFSYSGTWRPLCSNWTEMEANIAAETCFYLGFSDYRSFYKVPIYNNPLQIINKTSGPAINVKTVGKRCTGLFVKCSDVIDVTHLIEHANISKIINTMQGNPWNAEIYVNGKFKCTGTILDVDWIITSTSCFTNDFKLVNTYVAVLLGRSRTYLNVMGPHEQIIRIIESIPVSNSDIILLRLDTNIQFSRYVRPIRFNIRDYTVSKRETCIALGRNVNNATESVILQAVANCTFGFRCFKRTHPVKELCLKKSFTAWGGSIVCQSKHGWYAAAVFTESKGSCGFTTTTEYTSVQYWRANIKKLMKQAIFAVDAPPCPGFRCSLGRCLEEQKVCDKIQDCRDAGDEDPNYCSEKRSNCSISSSCVCLKSEMKCQNSKCVPKTAFCDTRNDCGDWSDEPEICNCRSYLALSQPQLICDGIRNCHDRTDEDPHLCKCKGYHFACGDKHCVPQDMVCDGVQDCPNGLDEKHCMALMSTPNSTITEVQVRTAGIWHPGCFPKDLTVLELESICEKIGFTGGSAMKTNSSSSRKTTWRAVTDPFTAIILHGTSRKNVIIAMRTGKHPFVTLKPDFNCYRLFLQCL